MTANQTLLVFTVAFWVLLSAVIKVSNIVQGRRFSDGPSLIPVIPIFPLLALSIGMVANRFISPFGTVVIVIAHVGWIGFATIMIMRSPKDRAS